MSHDQVAGLKDAKSRDEKGLEGEKWKGRRGDGRGKGRWKGEVEGLTIIAKSRVVYFLDYVNIRISLNLH